MGKMLFLIVILISSSLVYATYTTNIDSADCILFTFPRRISPFYEFNYNPAFCTGDFDGDGLIDIIILQSITHSATPGGEAQDFCRIIWGSSLVSEDSILIDTCNTIYFSKLSDLHIRTCLGLDINCDSRDDILFGIYSYMNMDTSILNIYYGRNRILWRKIDTLNYYDGIIRGITSTRYHMFSESFGNMVIGNFDEDSSIELLETGADCPTYSEFGHLQIFNIDNIRHLTSGALVPSESIRLVAIYGNPHFNANLFPIGNDYNVFLNSLGDLNGDGIEEFAKIGLRGASVLRNHIDIPYLRNNYIFWGRSESLWINIGVDSIINLYHDSLLTSIITDSVGVISSGDINGDGFNDLLISDYSVFIKFDHYSIDGWLRENDTSKLYIIYGNSSIDSIKGKIYDSGCLGELIVKSIHACDGTGGQIATGDFNGDGYDDIAVSSTNKQDPGIVYLIIGNSLNNFPSFFQSAQLKVIANNTICYGDTMLDFLLFVNNIMLVDINNDGLDDIVFTTMHDVYFRCSRFYYDLFNIIGKNGLFPICYIFFNKRPEIVHIYPSDTTLRPGDILAFKIAHKFPIAKGSIRLSINADTFSISAPELIYFPPASLLIFSPSIPWDSTKGYWVCIDSISDTIGTPPDSLPLCFGFNGATTAVYEPPKPQTLSLTCYPNPFNAEVRIRLRMPDADDIKIDIYDISGKLIDHIQKSKLTAGWHELVWRPNVSVPSGVYLLKVTAGGEAVVRRVVLVR